MIQITVTPVNKAISLEDVTISCSVLVIVSLKLLSKTIFTSIVVSVLRAREKRVIPFIYVANEFAVT